jgi:LacI family transcriptional regulator
MARRAVDYLHKHGHGAIGYVGAATPGSGGASWDGFFAANQDRCHTLRHHHTLRSLSWRLDEREQMALVRMLAAPDRPTAIFAAGFSFALSTYHAAAMAGLSIPDDLSVIGVDDAPCSPLLSPPLTTFRRPLAAMGELALELLLRNIHSGAAASPPRLFAELIERGSVAAPLWRK